MVTSSPTTPVIDVYAPVILWSTPRSVSTAFERVMNNSPAIDVLHEPYTDAYYFGSERRSDRYGHREDADFLSDRAEIETLIKSGRDGERTFVKELAFQGEPYVSDDLLKDANHLIITRHPGAVYASLKKLKPDFTEDEFGFKALHRVYQRLLELDIPVLIIDGDGFRADPEKTTRIVCDAIDIDFDPGMLHWNEGRIREWQPGEEKSQAIWHNTLESSRTILKPVKSPPEFQILPDHSDRYERALWIYHGMIEAQCPSRIPSDAKNIVPVS